eukprot:467697_1
MAEQTFYVGQKIEFMNGNNQKWYFGRIRTVETDRVLVQFSLKKWQDPKYDQWITKQNYEIRLRPRKPNKPPPNRNHGWMGAHNYNQNATGNQYGRGNNRNHGRHSHRAQSGPYNMRNNPNQDDMQVEVGDHGQYYQHGARYNNSQTDDHFNSKHIDEWTSDELIQWICSRHGVSYRNQKQLVKAITESNLTGKDFNSAIEFVHNVGETFPEVSKNGANHIYEALLQLRQTQTDNNVQLAASNVSPLHVPVVDNSRPNNNTSNNISYPMISKRQNKKLTEKNQVLTATNNSLNEQITRLQERIQALTRDKDTLKNENNTLKQEIVRLKANNKSNSQPLAQSTTEVNEQKNRDNVEVIIAQTPPDVQSTNSRNDMYKTYEHKTVKNWNNKDLLDWMETIGLQSQWQQIMIQVIKSNNCSGNDWLVNKNFKEFANKFNIGQKMLANRVFREFKKMKERPIENEENENVESNQRIVNVWDNKHISEWTCDILTEWIQSLNLNENDKSKTVDSIMEQEVTGEDFCSSIEEANDIMDSLEVTNECAMKIFSALEVVRANN